MPHFKQLYHDGGFYFKNNNFVILKIQIQSYR